ncbi:MAG: TIR domain-containing protein [Pseudomonadota bacterium]
MTDVFVSYASQDRTTIQRLVLALEQEGFSVWWDRAMQPGRRFDHQINDALETAAVVLAVWTSHSVESDWVRWEASEGLKRGCLIPVRLDNARLPSEFQRTHVLDLQRYMDGEPDPDGEFDRLCGTLRRLIDADAKTVAKGKSEEATSLFPFKPTEELDSQPAVAVLPFRNQSTDPEHDYFADGISEDLTHALSVWKSFPVISYSSTLPFKDQTISTQEIGKTLGATYVVTGQVRRAGNRIRVTAELTDAISNLQLWHDRWTRDLDDVFELQEEISRTIASCLHPTLVREARQVSMRKPPADMNAWDLGLRAHVDWNKHTRDDNLRARNLAERALQLDPESTFALVTLAETHYVDIFYNWTDNLLESLTHYVEAATRAWLTDSQDANANVQKGMSLMLQQRNPVEAMELMEKAVTLNPSLPLARTMLGQLLILEGRPGEGLAHLHESLRVKSNDPLIWGEHGALALGYYVAGDYEQGLSWAEKCYSARPQLLLAWAISAASCVALGRVDQGQEFITRMREHNPKIDPFEVLFPFLGASKQIREQFVEHLGQAGLELGGATIMVKRLMTKLVGARLFKSANKLERGAAL